ncbi:hypothetical protein [Algoriphagus antarcticus]|uniref:DUF3052 family protein n=1 Tax=Algoriphagus antarcticus TaxID=238540 RepID=A0A3E0DGS1_9BACT|nr:hypothetical protein [Algoriphagus antarcticus]REG81876.1 hypothetical protein C8N25_12433 [Algoriphagus antarcticus]
MDPILKKMTWKDGMNIQIWNAPPELKALISSWKSKGLINPEAKSDFMLAFVQTEAEVEKYFFEMQKLAPKDQQIWIAYPKGSSKRYKAQINRDSGWSYLGNFDYEAVRQIAINEDWSALRFRSTKYVKVMTRTFSVKDKK